MSLSLSEPFVASTTGASASKANEYTPLLADAMDSFEINTPARMLAFLSNVGEESGHLIYTEEIASGAAYEGRKDLGNVDPGDGVKYKGRGLIQITGKNNYQEATNALGTDYVNNPDQLAQPADAANASAWWWAHAGLNDLADQIDVSKPLSDPNNAAVFTQITKVINGGTNGLATRQNLFQQGWNFFTSTIPKEVETTASDVASTVETQTTALVMDPVGYAKKNWKMIAGGLIIMSAALGLVIYGVGWGGSKKS